MSILKRLYMGNLCPIEEAIPPNADYIAPYQTKSVKNVSILQ